MESQNIWLNIEEVCSLWAEESIKYFNSITSSKSGDIKLTSHTIYQKVHLRCSSNRYYRNNMRNDQLIEQLSKNFSGTTDENGWKVMPGGELLSPEGIKILAPELAKNRQMSQGTLSVPQVHLYGMPGWHLITSKLGFPDSTRVRFYLPVMVDNELLNSLAKYLQGCDYQWHLKIRTDISDPRPDRVVLYVAAAAAHIALADLNKIAHEQDNKEINNLPPTFCWSSSSGFGYAPDPSVETGASFGQLISQVVSDYLSGASQLFPPLGQQHELQTADQLAKVLYREIEYLLEKDRLREELDA